MRSQVTWILLAFMMSSSLLLTAEAISLATYYLLTQARHLQQPRQTPQIAPTWGEWSQWTMCTKTVGSGVRVRSRACMNGPCNRLRGDDYGVQMCNNPEMRAMEQNPEYLRMCTEDPTMAPTMSCKLYRENPSIAYNIFHSAGCVFQILGDPERLSENEDLVFGRPPDTEAGEMGLEFLFEDNLEVTDLQGGNTARERTEGENPLVEPLIATLTVRSCADQCDRAVVTASGVSRFGTGAPTNVAALISLVTNNPFIQGDPAAIRSSHRLCMLNCALRAGSSTLRTASLLAGPPQINDPSVIVNLAEVGEETGPRGKRSLHTPPKAQQASVSGKQERSLLLDLISSQRPGVDPDVVSRQRAHFLKEMDGNYDVGKVADDVFNMMDNAPLSRKSPISDKAPKTNTHRTQPRINVTLDTSQSAQIRHKRQTLRANDFTTLCNDREMISSDPYVLNLDDSQGELFFFEDNQQRFIRKKCAGSSFANDLFTPPQQVRHIQSRTNAVCKQGYLKRFGMLIYADPEGEFSFSDGERFSVGIRPFKLESHCSLSVVRRRG